MGRLEAVQTTRNLTSSNDRPLVNSQSADVRVAERQESARKPRPPIICYDCQEEGHISRNCPRPQRPRRDQAPRRLDDERAPTQAVKMVVSGLKRGREGDPIDSDRQVYIKLRINDATHKCLLDSGSDVTLFPSHTVRGLNITPCERVLTAANGTVIRVDGEVTVEAAAGSHKFQIEGVVSDHVSEIMLGNDVLHEHEVIWNFRDKKIEFDGHRFKLCGGAKQRWRIRSGRSWFAMRYPCCGCASIRSRRSASLLSMGTSG